MLDRVPRCTSFGMLQSVSAIADFYGGAEKENFLSFAGDLGLARSGFIDVAQRPLNERLVFRLVRLRDEPTAMHSQWIKHQAPVRNSPDAKTSSRQEGVSACGGSSQRSNWVRAAYSSFKRSPYIGRR